ncbi:Zn-dependent carboxypeptidase [Solibacillus silvestris StLB046]|uniref:Metal-dependent carboxypeptidase n=1 Tax=Solibacillus silvestris (strain StLB046) TaxID=1002809 RepID=F2F565_SOLSS|nr:carboxypeptidase M32 [Solibacillus silvestris]BAK18141.1 Zn-dependent carboxypeptidase [Solibacillus silvestris StLB046]
MQQTFINYVKKMQNYSEALSVIYWDMRTGAPRKGLEQRAEVIGTLSAELFALQTSDELGKILSELQNEKLDFVTQRLYEEVKKEYDESKKIPAEEFKAYTILKAKSEAAWEDAKEKSDFQIFLPYLKEVIDYQKRFVQYWGIKNGSAYNTLLDKYEPNMTTDMLDELFGELKATIVPLVKAIGDSTNKPDTSLLFKHFPKSGQHAASLELLKQLGYDFEAGRLDETVHPFMIGLNSGDIRITTKYDENDFRSAVFGTIHECGHALYEQNIDASLNGLPLSTGASMGIHESQSLFYENIIGRNESFWKHHYAILQKHSPEQFGNVPVDAFLKAINFSEPSLIRIEADELTYPLHIMIRYEIEREIFNGDLQAEDLPRVWNEKYEEYLGIRPQNDAEGVLQDMHWSDGSFGYFPSYALGFMYAAQWKHAMDQDIPNFDELCERGELAPIKDWLTDKVHQYGALKKPNELISEGTGEALSAKYLADYLENKYSQLYNL